MCLRKEEPRRSQQPWTPACGSFPLPFLHLSRSLRLCQGFLLLSLHQKNPLWQAQGSALLSIPSHPLQASSCLPFCGLVAPPLLLAGPHGGQGETHGHVSSLPSHIPLTPPGSFRDADTSLFLHPKVCRLKWRARPQPPLFLGICLQIPSCSKSPLVCWG